MAVAHIDTQPGSAPLNAAVDALPRTGRPHSHAPPALNAAVDVVRRSTETAGTTRRPASSPASAAAGAPAANTSASAVTASQPLVEPERDQRAADAR